MNLIASRQKQVMGFSDEQIRKVASLKDDLQARISKHLEEVEMLEDSIGVLDMILKDASFTKASSLVANSDSQKKAASVEKDSIPVIGGSGGEVVARAYVTPDQISIILEQDVKVSADTPPFRSFFLDRIIGDMKRKDSEETEAGKNQKESTIDCTVAEEDQYIRELLIKNYRHSERVNEIISTVGWSLARMVENNRR